METSNEQNNNIHSRTTEEKQVPQKPVTVTFIHLPHAVVYMDHTTKLIIGGESAAINQGNSVFAIQVSVDVLNVLITRPRFFSIFLFASM